MSAVSWPRSAVAGLFLLFVACPRGGGDLPGSRADFTLSGSRSDSGEVWLATKLLGQKIGYSVCRYVQTGKGFRFDNLNRITVGMMGKKQSVRTQSTVWANPDLSLRSFKFELSSQDGYFRSSGEVEKDRLIVNSGNDVQVLKLTRQLYPIEALGRVIAQANPAPGTILNYLTFDGTVMDTLPTVVEVLGNETIKIDSETQQALKVKVRRAKFDVTIWLDKNGMTLKEESPIGMNSYRVSEKEALAGESGYPPDVLRIFAVLVDTFIPQPGKVRRVVLEISGIDTAEFKLASANQHLLSAAPLRVAVSVPEPAKGIKLPINVETEYLKPSISIQSDAQVIKNKAREIVKGTRDAAEAARQILLWTCTSLKKEAVASLPNALNVLRNMKGDCNEHSVLYAALSRASGIPTKVVVGLVYLDGAFYYHAWNEVYLGKWVPVDPTFGEFPASALHLKLAEGELSRQAEVLGVVRKIRIKVVEFE